MKHAVILEIRTHSREIRFDWDFERLEYVLGTDARYL